MTEGTLRQAVEAGRETYTPCPDALYARAPDGGASVVEVIRTRLTNGDEPVTLYLDLADKVTVDDLDIPDRADPSRYRIGYQCGAIDAIAEQVVETYQHNPDTVVRDIEQAFGAN
jgi:hypothetical protein